MRGRVGWLGLLVLLLGAGSRPVDAQDDFYRGKTIRIVVGFGPGGGYDTYSRAIARHLGRHVPGAPTIVVENMPGAAGLLAANTVFRAGRPDGLTIVNFHGNHILGQLLGREGITFDARKFVWLGTPTRETTVCALTQVSGVTSAEQWMAVATPIKLGSLGPGDTAHDSPRVLQAALGLPIHLVRGYRGTPEIRLAAEAGEIAGGCWQWESIKSTWRNGLDAGQVNVVLQAGPRVLPDLPKVPLALDLAKTDEARQLLRFGIVVPTTIARVYALPPLTPPERVRTLRAAFLATLRDPQFLAETQQIKLDVDPIPGEELERLVGELFQMDPAVTAKLRELLR
jgi:tripartite-type tricarboxylate transporter receptor subunit TctC